MVHYHIVTGVDDSMLDTMCLVLCIVASGPEADVGCVGYRGQPLELLVPPQPPPPPDRSNSHFSSVPKCVSVCDMRGCVLTAYIRYIHVH